MRLTYAIACLLVALLIVDAVFNGAIAVHDHDRVYLIVAIGCVMTAALVLVAALWRRA